MAIEPTPDQHLPSQENMLLDYVHRLENHKEDRRAVHIHLSQLQSHNRREHHIRISANTFEPLIKLLEGQLFVLKNSDLIFIYQGDFHADVETSILKLRFLFSDDPLLNDSDDDPVNNPFRTYYDVEKEYNKILALVRTMASEEKFDTTVEDLIDNDKSNHQRRAETGELLTPRVLARVEQALRSADISNMVRRQFVCGLIGEATPQPLFSELYISIQALRETLMPGVDLSSSRWLFQHLTETLDRRVLAMLSKSTDRSITGEISINLNISTLLSPEFIQFDDSVIAAMRGSIVIELQKVDIFSDINAFLFQRFDDTF